MAGGVFAGVKLCLSQFYYRFTQRFSIKQLLYILHTIYIPGKERIRMHMKPPPPQRKLHKKTDSRGKSRCSVCSTVSAHPQQREKDYSSGGGGVEKGGWGGALS